MALLNQKLQGYTLVETLIAIVIIMIAFSIAMVVFVNVFQNTKTELDQEIQLKFRQIANDTKANQTFIDQDFPFDKYLISKTLEKYNNSKKLILLKLEAVDLSSGKTINEYKELVIDY